MERINYSDLVRNILEQHTGNDLSEETEVDLIFDEKRDRYLVIHLGWEGQNRVNSCSAHVDIREGKIWIQRDLTSPGIARELVELSVPKSDIVLGFRSAYMRQFTDFAIA